MQDVDGAIRILEAVIKCNTYEGVQQFTAKFENHDRRESNEDGKLHNVASLDQLEKNVEALNEKIKRLVDREKINFVDGSSMRGNLLMPTELAGETTTHKTLRKIWDCLMTDDIRKIGVYGMGGIGKTTIMKHLNNCLLEDRNGKFDKVIWVTVSKTLNIVKVQNDIARQFGFIDLSMEEDMTMRESKLYFALQKWRSRYVLILDDVWNKFRLRDIGIPEPTMENECKLVLTTRTLDVCNFMKTDESIQVGFLSEEEALNLFLDHVGRDILFVQDLKPIVEDVARKCARLPLAIVIVASSMAGKKKKYEWRTALRKLRSKSKDPDDKAKRVIEQLRFSYESLESKNLQECLLYCALYPEDDEIPIKDVIELLINVGIIGDMSTRQDQLDEGYDMLTTLKNVCFLEGVDSSRDEYVKMHDLVRDMTLQISGDRFMVEAGLRLNEPPKEKNWSKNLMEVSLMNNEITKFSFKVSPNCPKLLVLLLQYNPLQDIPNLFFKHMLELKVLNLSCTEIKILPNSLSNLVNLEALLLRWCYKLRYVPSLAMMKKLRSLVLVDSQLKELPQGLEELTNLNYLDLSHMELEIPHGLLPKLSQLQHLVTGGIMIYDNLRSLKKLEYFRGHFVDVGSFNESFDHRDPEGGLVNYNIIVGTKFPLRHLQTSFSYTKCVTLNICNISKSGDVDDCLMLPKDTQVLTIESNSSISSLCDVSSLGNVIDLRECRISYCDKIEVLISSHCCIMLPLKSLEFLNISYMPSLRVLIRRETIELRAFPTSTFSRLKEIVIESCWEMEEVFPIGLMPYLQSLEDIIITDCKNLVKIMVGMSTTSNITLPKLRNLWLDNLPKLDSICPSPNLMVCNSLECIYVLHTSKLKRMPVCLLLDNHGQPCPPPSLLEIKMTAQDWETMEWAHPNAKTVLRRFHREPPNFLLL